MKIYRDLIFRGSPAALDRLIAEIGQRLTGSWARNYAREREVSRAALGAMYCFSCSAKDDRPSCELWVATSNDGDLYVSNVLATEYASLTYDQYNAIVKEFYDRFAAPAALVADVEVELQNGNPQISDFLSPSTAAILCNFSQLANRFALQPLDRKRWNEFLTEAHREKAALSADMLQRWLTQEEHWSEDQANSLAVEYENARDLLQVYESRPNACATLVRKSSHCPA